MSKKDPTNVETRGGNTKFTGINRKFVADAIARDLKTQETAKAAASRINEKYGSGKYTDEGIIARIYGEYLVDLSKLSDFDKNSFEYGYYEAAERQLEILIKDNKISDFIRSSLDRKTKFEKEEEIGLYIKEVLYQIGYRDSYDKNPKIKETSEIIKANNDYFEGYMTGIEEQKLSPKAR